MGLQLNAFKQGDGDMTQFWSAVARRLEPYVPGEQPRVANLIKLNTNEHALPPSPRALQAMAAVLNESLRRYPDPNATSLGNAIAEQEGLQPDQVFTGNGSDEVLAHVFQGLLAASTSFVTPDITYSFYPVWANLFGLAHQTLPLREDFSIDVEGLCQCSGAILLANPNAPTGIALTLDQLDKVLSSDLNRLVVVDEAYFGFGAQSASALLGSFPNLLITRSLSKSHALAGLRVGYALGSKDLIEALRRVKDSFNSYPLDLLAQTGAAAALKDVRWFEEASATIIANRAYLAGALVGLGFEVCPSEANFVFAAHQDVKGKLLFEHLRSNNILVRRWDHSRIENHLRITVGTREQCEALVAVLAANV
jgi:histidinol-phosphate aminotransferase